MRTVQEKSWKWLYVVLLGMILLAGATVAASAAPKPSGPVRLAIIPGEGDRAPEEELVAAMEVALSEMDGVMLLERAQVRRVLTEQKISAAGLTDPRTAVRVGQLLSVDMFLFVEVISAEKARFYRWRVVDAHTGITLGSTFREASSDGFKKTPLLDMARRAVDKQKVPVDDRHYVGVLGVVNEEPGHTLDRLARTVEMLLVHDLQANKDSIVLDRQHLRHLREEHDLTGIDQKIKTSTTVIEGGLRRARGENRVELRLKLSPLVDDRVESLKISFDPDKLDQFRQKAVTFVCKQLVMHSSIPGPTESSNEGAMFLEQSKLLEKSGKVARAVQAAEAAYTLWPNRKTRQQLIQVYGEKMSQVWDKRNSNIKCFSEVPEKIQIRYLRNDLKRLELVYEQLRNDLDPEKVLRFGSLGKFGDLFIHHYTGVGVVIKRAKGEAAELQQMVVALRHQVLDMIAAAAKRDMARYGSLYWNGLSGAFYQLSLGSLSRGDFSHLPEQAAGMERIFQYWSQMEAGGEAELDFLEDRLRGLHSLAPLRKHDSPGRSKFVEVFRTYSGHSRPFIRIVALSGLMALDSDAVDAENLLRCLRDDVRVVDHHTRAFCDVAMRAVKLLEDQQKADVAANYCNQLMTPLLENAVDPWQVMRWLPLARHWGRLVAETKGDKQGDAVYKSVLVSLRNKVKWFPDAAERFKRQIDKVQSWRRRTLSLSDPQPSPSSGGKENNPWDQYKIQSLGLNLPGPAKAARVDGDRLYCFILEYERDCKLTVSVHRFPVGGPAIETSTISLDRSTEYYLSSAMIDDQLYIGTSGGLVAMSESGTLQLLTEEDEVPATDIWAMEAYDGKLYLGLGGDGDKSGFGVYDPSNRRGRIIFSSTAVDKKEGDDMEVARIVHDEARDCLWLVGDSLRRYDPATDTLHQPSLSALYVGVGGFHRVVFCNDGLLWRRFKMCFLGFDSLDSKGMEKLVHRPGSNSSARFGPTLTPQTVSTPVWYDGTKLITFSEVQRNPVLCMYREGKEPSTIKTANFHFKGSRQIYRTPQGFLGLAANGKGYLIRKKDGARHEVELDRHEKRSAKRDTTQADRGKTLPDAVKEREHPTSPRRESAQSNARALRQKLSQYSDRKVAQKKWEALGAEFASFCRKHPSHPATGSIALSWIDVALWRLFDIEQAEEAARHAMSWVRVMVNERTKNDSPVERPTSYEVTEKHKVEELRSIMYESYVMAGMVAYLGEEPGRAFKLYEKARLFLTKDSGATSDWYRRQLKRFARVRRDMGVGVVPETLLRNNTDEKQKTALRLAELARANRNWEKAEHLLVALLNATSPFSEPSERLKSYLFWKLHVVMRSQRKRKKSREYFKRGIKPDKWDPESFGALGIDLYKDMGESPLVRNRWKRLYTSFPRHPMSAPSLYFYAITALYEGDCDTAQRAFKRYIHTYRTDLRRHRIKKVWLKHIKEKCTNKK